MIRMMPKVRLAVLDVPAPGLLHPLARAADGLPKNNGQINQAFLASTDEATRSDILGAIAAHYGVSQREAFDEVVGKDAEDLLDYLMGSTRAAVSVLMQRHHVA